MTNLLFICTGNYYRSRFAEILFNHYAQEKRLAHVAFSRGLEVFRQRNNGPISPHASAYLKALGLEPDGPISYPEQLSARDFRIADQVILMDRAEHYPLMQQYFPKYAEKVEYWSFQDVQYHAPEEMLPLLERQIRSLVDQY